MKKLIYTLALLFALLTQAQTANRNFDFIITIDEVFVPSLMNCKIVIQDSNGEKTIPFQYRPGNLSVTEDDYQLIENGTGKLMMRFSNNDYSTKEHQVNSYEIEIGKNWFEKSYMILKVYNTRKKKYKKMFDPLENKDYTFEIEYAGGSMLRVRKK